MGFTPVDYQIVRGGPREVECGEAEEEQRTAACCESSADG